MDDAFDILQEIRRAAGKRILFLPHALKQMTRPDRMIRTQEVRAAIETGTVIENYPNDARGHSCLLLGLGNGNRPVHVVCSPKEDYLAIITAYLPNPADWTNSFSKRKKR